MLTLGKSLLNGIYIGTKIRKMIFFMNIVRHFLRWCWISQEAEIFLQHGSQKGPKNLAKGSIHAQLPREKITKPNLCRPWVDKNYLQFRRWKFPRIVLAGGEEPSSQTNIFIELKFIARVKIFWRNILGITGHAVTLSEYFLTYNLFADPVILLWWTFSRAPPCSPGPAARPSGPTDRTFRFVYMLINFSYW